MGYVDRVLETVAQRNPGENVFQQAVHEVLESLRLAVDANPAYEKAGLLERLVEPERVIMLTVVSVYSSTARSDLIRAVCVCIRRFL